MTVVRGLPLPGYKGTHVGLPARGLLHGCWTQHRPDVVYVATEGPLGWSAVRTARRLRIPVFSGFHTNFHSYSRHYRLGWLQPLIFRYLCRFHNRTRGTLVPNVDLRDHLQAVGLKNVSVLGRGVDSQLFTPERRCAALRRTWGVAENDLAVLYVGRVAPEKNLGLAVAAYRVMQQCSASDEVYRGRGRAAACCLCKKPILILSSVAYAPVSNSPGIMPRQMCFSSPAKRKHLAMSPWKPWPAVWWWSPITMPRHTCT